MVRRAASPTRQDVLDAAERLLAAEGPEALSMRRLAGELGTSYQVVYSRLGDKAQLVRALHDAGFDRLRASATSIESAASDEDDRLVATALAYLDHALDHPALFDVMFGAPIAEFARDDEARKVEWEAFRACWVAACEDWLATHFDTLPRGAAVRLAWRLWTAVHGVTVVHLAGHPSPSGDVRREIAEVVQLLLRSPLG